MKPNKPSGLPNRIWRECGLRDAQYYLYTEDPLLIRQIQGWVAYRKGDIRLACDYSHASRPDVCYACQFRFPKRLLQRVIKAAGCLPETLDEKVVEYAYRMAA